MAKTKTENDQPATQIGDLIDRLGPINNKCRSADGIDKVELLWDIGDTLLDSANPGERSNVAVHSMKTGAAEFCRINY